MRLNKTPKKPTDPDTEVWYRSISNQVNLLSEGRMAARHTALDAAPTSGDWARGDFIHNSQPSELGVPTTKYIIHGWQCVVGGSPGTWVQCRFLTGN